MTPAASTVTPEVNNLSIQALLHATAHPQSRRRWKGTAFHAVRQSCKNCAALAADEDETINLSGTPGIPHIRRHLVSKRDLSQR
jgi:hypothetical protein